MNSRWEKLRKLRLHKSEPKENWDHHISVHLEGLTQAAKDMKDMRTCYDSLLSAAAAMANSAYEFSESLLEMGNCLMERTAMHDDGDSGGALTQLGGVQLELHKLVDTYRSHIMMTITNPSESLLSELRTVEEMKLQCDKKRETFEYVVGQLKEKGKLGSRRGEMFTSEQLPKLSEEYNEAARLYVFRVQSLKQGQSRSLLTQAARHHVAQINFFRKGLQSLEAVEPHIRDVAEKQHIDYELCEVNEGEEDGDEGNGFEINDYGQLSFDDQRNKQEEDNASTSRNSMELDQLSAANPQTSRIQGNQMRHQQRQAVSHSAPLYPEKFDPTERFRETRTSVQKLNGHVLPTPADAKDSIISATPLSSTIVPGGSSKNLWHSSPVDIEKQKKYADFSKSQKSVEDYSKSEHSLPLPRPLAEGDAVTQFDTHNGFDNQKIKRQAFSGPLGGKPSANKPLLPISGSISSTELPQSISGVGDALVSGTQGRPSSLNVSQSTPPPLVSSPKVNELHELPRPPDSFSTRPTQTGVTLGHSAPLVSRNRQVSPTDGSLSISSKEGSPLPLPKLTVSRSFSIPSSNRRVQ